MIISKNAEFWLTRIIIILAVIAGAIAFLMNNPESGQTIETTKGEGKSDASISESVSDFYEEFSHTSRDPIKEQFGEDTIMLKENNEKPVGDAIERASKNTYEPTNNWQGAFKERAFAAQSTIMQEATNHISKEGFNLVWDLDQDYVVRHRYKSTNTLTGMLEEIAGAIDSNFNQPIMIYYCSKKRALVITVRESKYLHVNCEKITSESQNY